MKIEAITLREIHLPLVNFFETSFHRLYSRRILLVTVHSEGIDGWGESVVGEDPFYSSEWIDSAWPTLSQYLIPALLGKRIDTARLPAAIRQGSSASHGQGRAGKRSVGRGSHAKTAAAVEIAGRDTSADSLRRLHRYSGFGGAIVREDSDRTGRRLSPHKNQSQTWMGRQRSRTHPLALGGYYSELRREFRLHTRSGKTPAQVRPVQSADD